MIAFGVAVPSYVACRAGLWWMAVAYLVCAVAAGAYGWWEPRVQVIRRPGGWRVVLVLALRQPVDEMRMPRKRVLSGRRWRGYDRG